MFGSPESIRAALLPEHANEFGAALTAARRTLRLDQLRSTLQVWRRVALLTREDPEAALCLPRMSSVQVGVLLEKLSLLVERRVFVPV